MNSVKNVLVGVDLHEGDRLVGATLLPTAEAVVAQAHALALGTGAKLVFVAVLDLTAEAEAFLASHHQAGTPSVQELAADHLAKLVETATSAGIHAESEVVVGSPWRALSDAAERHHSDLILVGARAHHWGERGLFGSTGQKLIRHAKAPVWICKPEELRDVREIAVAIDGQAASLALLNSAIAIAGAIRARLFIFHAATLSAAGYLQSVGVTKERVEELKSIERERISGVLHSLLVQTDYRTLHHGVKVDIVDGTPEETIPEFITANEVDLLLIGTHSRSDLTAMFLGSTAERLLNTVRCSLLTLKP